MEFKDGHRDDSQKKIGDGKIDCPACDSHNDSGPTACWSCGAALPTLRIDADKAGQPTCYTDDTGMETIEVQVGVDAAAEAFMFTLKRGSTVADLRKEVSRELGGVTPEQVKLIIGGKEFGRDR